MKPCKIVIVVEGGNITAVLSDQPDIEVEILDYDSDPLAQLPSSLTYPCQVY